MSRFHYPNESETYRSQRNELLELEIALRAQIERVAQKRRELPPGGLLKKSYEFQRIGKSGVIENVPFADLFGSHNSLILYSLMFGADWDAPCPSCTGLVDGFEISTHAVNETCALAVVAYADAQKLHDWATKRGWRRTNLLSASQNSYLLDYCGFPDCKDPGMVSALNVFRKNSEGIFHFWGSELAGSPMKNGHPRHADMVWPLWNLLDLTPEGRGEAMVPKQDYEHKVFSERVLKQTT